uniref:Uncharacterized protein n=1 Tax=Picocystis salinarum TaxID=88271 RepID=A0A7S3UF35_9CHLO
MDVVRATHEVPVRPRRCRGRREKEIGMGRLQMTHVVCASRDQVGGEGWEPPAYEGGLDPMLEMAVPYDQRPVNELTHLRGSPMYTWAELSNSEYAKKLTTLFLAVSSILGGPISAQTFAPGEQPLECFLSTASSGLVVVVLSVLRVYLGWSYVGNRLLSAVIPYEETGWYDGQIWAKPPEVLARDRLLGLYVVKPALGRLKNTLLGCVGIALLFIVALTWRLSGQ